MSIFGKPKSKVLAAKISIKSPQEFKESIRKLKENELTLHEKRALVLARTRAKLQLRRKVLSLKERKEMLEISKTKIK